MLVLNEAYEPVDRIRPLLWHNREQDRLTTIIRLVGRLVAYMPHDCRAYYRWALIVTYRPAQHISVYQFSPAQLRLILFSRWELGVILGSWLLGLRLRQPLAWFRRVQAV
jgi:hypothetical protein